MAGYTHIEKYLIEWVDKKYAGRVISKVNTEWEAQIDAGSDPSKSEYEWMRDRVLQIHRGMNTSQESNSEEEATD